MQKHDILDANAELHYEGERGMLMCITILETLFQCIDWIHRSSLHPVYSLVHELMDESVKRETLLSGGTRDEQKG